MGSLSFTKKTKPAAEQAAAKAPDPQPAPKHIGGITFMKKGGAAKALMVTEDAKAEAAQAEHGKLFRFWMKPDDERVITFLDGSLDEEGMLDIPMYYQHTLRVNGLWTDFVCVGEQEVCPLCEAGEKHSLVGIMTVIDHTPYTIKKGQNAGNTIKNSRKLFVAKRGSIKKLSKKAAKQGGLTGCTFEVTRDGDKDPNVGSDFEFVGKFHQKELMAKYDMKAEDVVPADYGEEITYRDAATLLELGVGKVVSGIGNEAGVNTEKLGDEL